MALYSAAPALRPPTAALAGAARAHYLRAVEDVVLGFGANLGTRAAFIDTALHLLGAAPGLTVVARSPLYETPPLGPPQPDYLNAAARVRWAGTLEGLFALTASVETLLLRTRDVRWGPRTLDIDLLSAARGAYQSATLTLPHPGLYERAFALLPLCDVAPPWADVAALRARCRAPLRAIPHPVEVTERPDGRHVTSHDRAEWLARTLTEAIEMAWVCTTGPRAPGPGALGTIAFRVPDGSPERVLAALFARAEAALAAGFAVRACVFAAAPPGAPLCGLFAGTHGGGARALPAVAVRAAGSGPGAGPYAACLSRA